MSPRSDGDGSRPATSGGVPPLSANVLLELFANPLDPGYADAAEARRRDGPRPRWRSAGAYLLRTLTLLVVGFLLAIAYREVVSAEPERSRAHAGLVTEIKAGQQRTDQLQADSDRLSREVAATQRVALGGTAEELARAREQEAAAGMAAVTGPGVVVRLSDPPAPVDPTTGRPATGDINRVLDVDLQSVVNGLWAAGAEAVAINGQRLTSTSTIRAAGSAILVDFRPVTGPYEVAAIGPDNLEAVFARTAAAASMADLAARYGLGYSTWSERSLSLPAAPGPPLRYAHPASAASTSPPGGTK